MSELKIERHKWQPDFTNETWIKDDQKDQSFEITLKQGEDIEIEFDWDYGYGGRGTARMYIPHEILVKLIKEIY